MRDHMVGREMVGGYMKKFLWVNLSTGSIDQELPQESLLRDFLGGYGVGARVLVSRQEPSVHALGPQNILGFLTGPLTGTPAIGGTRWTVVAKSPLTGTWGDANGGGFFAPTMRFAGFDAIFFTGSSEQPPYLLVKDGNAELRDASALWGRDTYETDDLLKAKFGDDAEIACIGPAGENLALVSGVVTAKGRTAARSGLGAVMGSKKLKAIVAKGSATVPVAHPELAKKVRAQYIQEINSGAGYADAYRGPGTPGSIVPLALVGDTPTKNWGGVCSDEFDAQPIGYDAMVEYKIKKNACWRCPIACWGHVGIDYEGSEVEAHVPEYESASALGTDCLNNDLRALIRANDLCNRHGLDTISTGATLAFAMECYEKGLISNRDTDGIELTWGNGDAIVGVIDRMAKREGFGDVLADGVKVAAETIGREAQPYAIRFAGQELPMHDPRFEPGMALTYMVDATPGRHMPSFNWFEPPGFDIGLPRFGENRDVQEGRGRYMKPLSCLSHSANASGVCLFVIQSTNVPFLPESLTAVTGQHYTLDDVLLIGERIANIRQAFNVREGSISIRNLSRNGLLERLLPVEDL